MKFKKSILIPVILVAIALLFISQSSNSPIETQSATACPAPASCVTCEQVISLRENFLQQNNDCTLTDVVACINNLATQEPDEYDRLDTQNYVCTGITQDSCIDSDGQNTLTRGTVSIIKDGQSSFESDDCYQGSATQVSEIICDGNQESVVILDCPTNRICVEGACVLQNITTIQLLDYIEEWSNLQLSTNELLKVIDLWVNS